MAAIDFPNYGRLMTGQFIETSPTNLLRTTFESGAEKQVRRTNIKKTVRDVTYLFTAAEFATFKTWFDVTAVAGSQYFNWVDPVDNVTKDARIVNGAYTATPLTKHFTAFYVTFQVESYG
jgi:hypothetical protein